MRRAVLVIVLLATGCVIGPGRGYRVRERLSADPFPRLVTSPREGIASEDLLSAAPPPPLMSPEVAEPETIERRLANGVRVLILPRHGFPSATVYFVIHGTSGTPPAVSLVFARTLGAGGDEHALRYDAAEAGLTTWGDGLAVRVTALSPVIVSSAARFFELAVSPAVGADVLTRAKASVRVVATRSSPLKTASVTLWSSMFPRGHAYHAQGEGIAVGEVDAVDGAALTAFRDRYLTTSNVSVVAVGDVDAEVLVRALDRSLAALPRVPRAPAPTAAQLLPATSCSDRIETVNYVGAKQASFAIGYPTVPAAHVETVTLELLVAVAVARLNGLRYGLGATSGLGASLVPMRDAGFLQVYGTADPARTAEVLARATAQLDSLRTQPVSDEELEAAKAGVTRYVSTRAAAAGLAWEAVVELPTSAIASHSQRTRQLSAEDVRAAAERYLVTERRCVVVVMDGRK